MENFQLYLHVFLMSALTFNMALVERKSRSAIITQVQTVTAGVSSAKLIECAFHLMKSYDSAFVRIAEGSDVCEQLLPPLSFSDFFESGFEYIEKSSVFSYFNDKYGLIEKVENYLYRTVKINDAFRFVMKVSDKDGFSMSISFFTSDSLCLWLAHFDTTVLLGSYDTSSSKRYELRLRSPFQNFKTYTILFKLLESHWEINIDDELLTTISYYKIDLIQRVEVSVGHHVTYLSKSSHPRI